MTLVQNANEIAGKSDAVVALAGPSVALATRMPSAGSLRDNDPVKRGEIVVLTGDSDIPAMMVRALAEHFGHITLIVEGKQPVSAMIKRRFKMLGPLQAAGQVAFGVLLKVLHKQSAARKAEIIEQGGLSSKTHSSVTRYNVSSVNDEACRDIIKAANPKVVVLIGTRMVRANTLHCVDAPFINYHAGLNPSYRGMNGGYWALAHGDLAGAGVTVHLVDEGVDTGKELYWCRFKPGSNDNFVTYPLLQAVVGRDLLIGSVRDALDGVLKPQDVSLASAQWFHPTLWGYVWRGVTKGVW